MTDFNENHPEMLEEEVFLCNVGTVDDPNDESISRMTIYSLEECGYETARTGQVAYSKDGKPQSSASRPVFIKREELERARADFVAWLNSTRRR